jgi:hypothetical protein
MFNTDENPTEAGMYLVDRGDKFKGHWYRYYDGKGNWGLMFETYQGAFGYRDQISPLKTLPWRAIRQRTEEEMVAAEVQEKPVKVSKVKKDKLAVTKVTEKVEKAPKVAKVTKTKGNDGTVFFRADRSKWVAVMNGKQEAARDTKEGALAFLFKKYKIEGIVV